MSTQMTKISRKDAQTIIGKYKGGKQSFYLVKWKSLPVEKSSWQSNRRLSNFHMQIKEINSKVKKIKYAPFILPQYEHLQHQFICMLIKQKIYQVRSQSQRVKEIIGKRKIDTNIDYLLRFQGQVKNKYTWVRSSRLKVLNSKRMKTYFNQKYGNKPLPFIRHEFQNLVEDDQTFKDRESKHLNLKYNYFDRIIAKKEENGKNYYLVKWRGISASNSTWLSYKQIKGYYSNLTVQFNKKTKRQVQQNLNQTDLPLKGQMQFNDQFDQFKFQYIDFFSVYKKLTMDFVQKLKKSLQNQENITMATITDFQNRFMAMNIEEQRINQQFTDKKSYYKTQRINQKTSKKSKRSQIRKLKKNRSQLQQRKSSFRRNQTICEESNESDGSSQIESIKECKEQWDSESGENEDIYDSDDQDQSHTEINDQSQSECLSERQSDHSSEDYSIERSLHLSHIYGPLKKEEFVSDDELLVKEEEKSLQCQEDVTKYEFLDQTQSLDEVDQPFVSKKQVMNRKMKDKGKSSILNSRSLNLSMNEQSQFEQLQKGISDKRKSTRLKKNFSRK